MLECQTRPNGLEVDMHIVPLYRGKGDIQDYGKNRPISLMSMVSVVPSGAILARATSDR